MTQSCLTLHDPIDCSPPGSSVHGIIQRRILEWTAISFSRGSCPPRDRTQVSLIADRCFPAWATREAQIPAPNNPEQFKSVHLQTLQTNLPPPPFNQIRYIHSQILRIRTWASLGDNHSAYHTSLVLKRARGRSSNETENMLQSKPTGAVPLGKWYSHWVLSSPS